MRIVNIHRIDNYNLGDLVSAPTLYFGFSDIIVRQADILSAQDLALENTHLILGGGGLLDTWFKPKIDCLAKAKRNGKLIAWGIGQQMDESGWWKKYRNFSYITFLQGFDLVGIRDYVKGYDWVPCASCMHPSFDKPRQPKYEFVIYSHKRLPIPIVDFPMMSNENSNLDATLDFLGSGETVITSSYHGMYWALLLNRRVLVFPFNSKFFIFKYPVSVYPAVWQKVSRLQRLLRPSSSATHVCKSVTGWRIAAGAAQAFPDALAECRSANKEFYAKVLNYLD